jgi:uncharacterized zinc-type alcohol dehydrogenase-like protein
VEGHFRRQTSGRGGRGGLGQMGIRLAKAMGNTVVAISTSPSKREVAIEIGADEFVVSKDPESLKTIEKSLDLILNTVSANHDINLYLNLLKRWIFSQLDSIAFSSFFYCKKDIAINI